VVLQGEVALAHDAQIDRIERGHHQDAGQERVDLEPGVQDSRGGAGQHARQKRQRRGHERVQAHIGHQARRQGRAERRRAVHGDVGEAKNTIR